MNLQRRAWLLALPLLSLSWAGGLEKPRAQATDAAPLTVVTYNIRYENTIDGENGWAYRRAAMAAYLRGTKADLIGLQEVTPQQRAYLAEQMTSYGWYGVGRNAEHDQGEGAPLFYRRDRFDVLDKGTFWLSTTPATAGSVGWDAALPRVVSWLRLRDRRTGRAFLAVNTHFDHRGPTARIESSRLIVGKIDELATVNGARIPVILTGDFNCRPDEAPYAEIARLADAPLRLVDAQHVSRTPHQGGDSTSNAFKAIAPGAKIDYVFVRDVAAVLSHRIEDPRVDGRFVSDHQPIVAEISVAASR